LDLQTTQSSLTVQSSNVHSSFNAGKLQISSGANGNLVYDYGFGNDLHDRWYSDVTTHKIVSYFWARIDTAGNSGDVTAVFSGQSVPIAHSDTFQRYRLEANITSATNSSLDFQVSSYSGSDFNLYVDDVLTSVDGIEIFPNWNFAQLANQNMGIHTTLQGREAAYLWGQYGEWSVELSHMNDIQTAAINQWWRKNRNLCFTYNSSDTSNMFVVRMANTVNPFTGVVRPYQDYATGVLKLQTLRYSLDF
jgi:hypothetical protein